MISQSYDPSGIPPTLTSPGAASFWSAVLLTGVGAGIAAALLTTLLFAIQHRVWPAPHILDAAAQAGAWRHILILLFIKDCEGKIIVATAAKTC